ncbi:MAG: hypothetical protein ACRCTI_08960 [Beijerinckiaceae bacterium]
MQRSFYAVILAAIAFMWMAQKMLSSVRRIESGASGQRILDTRLTGYTAEEAHRFISLIGDDGRTRYRWQLRLEWLFIAAYAILFGSTGIALTGFIYNQGWKLLAWVPMIGGFLFVAAALADLDEGQHIARLLKTWPKTDPAAAARAAKATRLKWMLVFVGAALLILGCAFAVIAKLKGA